VYEAQETRNRQIFKSALHLNADLQLGSTPAMIL